MDSSACTVNQSTGNSENTSSSHFLKTVCLQDWWLIKAEKDFNGKRLAVAGYTSRKQQAVRVFASAPITKRHDVFTLETADGICVIIKGIINKFRTNQNGFPSEVFSQFVLGFPPYWEDYAGNYFDAEVNIGVVSRVNANSSTTSMASFLQQETSYEDEMGITEDMHDSNKDILGKTKLGHESSGVVQMEQCDLHQIGFHKSSIVDQKLLSQIVSEMLNTDASETSSFTDPVNFNVDNVKNDASWNLPLQRGSDNDIVSSFEDTVVVPVEPFTESSRRNCSESNKDSKERSPGNGGNANSSAVNKVFSVEFCGVNNSNSSTAGVYRMQKEFSSAASIDDNIRILRTSLNSISNAMKCPSMASGYEANIVTPTKVDIDILNDYQTEDIASKCHVKCKINGQNSLSKAIGNPDEEKLDLHSSVRNFKSGENKNLPGEISGPPEGKVLKQQSRNTGRRQKERQTICGLKAKRNNLNSDSVSFRHVENLGENVASASGSKNVSTKSDVELQLPVHKLKKKKQKDVCPQNLQSSVHIDAKHKTKHGNSSNQIVTRSKSTYKSVGSSARLVDTILSNDLKVREEQKSNAKEVDSSGKHAKGNFNATQASSLSTEEKAKSSIVSPEDLSYKRSRSGRLLMPTLDFWRNQVAVYDAKRQVTGIQEGLHVAESSGGHKSESHKKRRWFS
ncbi:kinetochore-associated protein KNL-2 homolog [Malania oleifera]|uniref:kinetochore-associated protein KNL-2 homolog n=1 Tax=Malania oleifera TaxID=397392 RepID=UPI0025AE15AE|nr:kinetochore-associated protein KNL-2 homolog [Malania oleifera]